MTRYIIVSAFRPLCKQSANNRSICRNFSSKSQETSNSFSESVIRPLLKKSIKQFESSWAQATGQVRSTILHLLLNKDSLELKKEIPSNVTNIESAELIEKCIDHPILGKLICDLKYKRVYLTDINSLVKANVWEKQRTLRHERAELIANAKIENNSCKIMPGVITCYHVENTSNIGEFV